MKAGGVLEKRGVIRIDYGVWGERVPSEPNGGSGSGGVTPSQILYKSYQLRHNLVMDRDWLDPVTQQGDSNEESIYSSTVVRRSQSRYYP
jgi:hypothetical protein